MYIYIYIYIQREREREREKEGIDRQIDFFKTNFRTLLTSQTQKLETERNQRKQNF